MDDENMDLDSTLREQLVAARALLEPPAQAREELFARLSLALDAGGSSSQAAELIRPGSRVVRTFSRKALVAAVITSAVVGLAAASQWSRSRSEPKRNGSETQSPPAEQSVRPSTEGLRGSSDVGELGELETVETKSVVRAPKPPAEPVSAATSPESEPLGVYEEISRVRQAQAALRDGDAAHALGLMQSLDDDKTSGALLAERGVTRVLALCALGRESEAETAARAVLSRGDGAVYQERLANSCARAAVPSAASDESAASRTQNIEPTRKEQR